MIQITQEEYNTLQKYKKQIEKMRKAQKKYAEKHREECYARTKRWHQRKKTAQ
jgi:hypothetical protein